MLEKVIYKANLKFPWLVRKQPPFNGKEYRINPTFNICVLAPYSVSGTTLFKRNKK